MTAPNETVVLPPIDRKEGHIQLRINGRLMLVPEFAALTSPYVITVTPLDMRHYKQEASTGEWFRVHDDDPPVALTIRPNTGEVLIARDVRTGHAVADPPTALPRPAKRPPQCCPECGHVK